MLSLDCVRITPTNHWEAIINACDPFYYICHFSLSELRYLVFKLDIGNDKRWPTSMGNGRKMQHLVFCTRSQHKYWRYGLRSQISTTFNRLMLWRAIIYKVRNDQKWEPSIPFKAKWGNEQPESYKNIFSMERETRPRVVKYLNSFTEGHLVDERIINRQHWNGIKTSDWWTASEGNVKCIT